MKANKLLALLRDNARAEGPAPIRLETTSDAEAHVYVYDVIDAWWGASAASLLDALKAVGDRTVHLHINSPGGDVFEARAMAAAIVAHPGKVVSHIDGLAASAATYLALAGNVVRIVDGSLFMVHNSWTLALGNANDLRGTADLLEKIDGTIAADYQRRTGASAEQVKAWMDAETWFTAQEALDAKFVDAIDPNTKAGNQQALASARAWDLSAYSNAPEALRKPANVQRAPAPMNSAESDFLSALSVNYQSAVALASTFVRTEPQAVLREYAEDVIEDCAGELELLKLWLQVGAPPAPAAADQVQHQLAVNRNRLRLVTKI